MAHRLIPNLSQLPKGQPAFSEGTLRKILGSRSTALPLEAYYADPHHDYAPERIVITSFDSSMNGPTFVVGEDGTQFPADFVFPQHPSLRPPEAKETDRKYLKWVQYPRSASSPVPSVFEDDQ